MAREILLDDESIPLHVRRDECLRLLNLALAETKSRGVTMVLAEAGYYSAKADAAFQLLEDGATATLIQTVIKGVGTVNEALSRFHRAEVEYKNAAEAVNCYKLQLRSLESEIEREWSQANRT